MINNWEYFQPLYFKWEIKNPCESVRPLETLILPFFKKQSLKLYAFVTLLRNYIAQKVKMV